MAPLISTKLLHFQGISIGSPRSVEKSTKNKPNIGCIGLCEYLVRVRIFVRCDLCAPIEGFLKKEMSLQLCVPLKKVVHVKCVVVNVFVYKRNQYEFIAECTAKFMGITVTHTPSIMFSLSPENCALLPFPIPERPTYLDRGSSSQQHPKVEVSHMSHHFFFSLQAI